MGHGRSLDTPGIHLNSARDYSSGSNPGDGEKRLIVAGKIRVR
jgi:hypothetical protein